MPQCNEGLWCEAHGLEHIAQLRLHAPTPLEASFIGLGAVFLDVEAGAEGTAFATQYNDPHIAPMLERADIIA